MEQSYKMQPKIILNKCILYVFFDYCYSDRLLSQMNYFSTEVIFEEGRVLYQTHNFFHVKRNCETMPVVTLFHFMGSNFWSAIFVQEIKYHVFTVNVYQQRSEMKDFIYFFIFQICTVFLTASPRGPKTYMMKEGLPTFVLVWQIYRNRQKQKECLEIEKTQVAQWEMEVK